MDVTAKEWAQKQKAKSKICKYIAALPVLT